jgi:hypothetical protein
VDELGRAPAPCGHPHAPRSSPAGTASPAPDATTNPIESTFATVRLRTKVTKGPGSRAAGIAVAYKLIDAAQARWRAVNAPHLVALVRAGAIFHKDKLLERPVEITPPNHRRASPRPPDRRSPELTDPQRLTIPLRNLTQPLALTAAQRCTPPTRQCTLNYQEPDYCPWPRKSPWWWELCARPAAKLTAWARLTV